MHKQYNTPEDLLREKPLSVKEQILLLSMSSTAVVIDIETIGLSPNSRGEIIEIGAVKVNLESGETLEEFATFIKPYNYKKIPKKTIEITGITDKDVENAPLVTAVIADLYDFIGDSLVVCHNANFDWFRFLLPIMQTGGRICTNNVICSLMISRKQNKILSSHKLDDLCEHYGIIQVVKHRAIDDARNTAKVAFFMKKEVSNTQPKEITQPYIVPYAQEHEIKIKKISPYTGKTKGSGEFIYFTTSIGVAVYGQRLNSFSLQKLAVAKNVDLEVLKNCILRHTNVSSFSDLLTKRDDINKAISQIEMLSDEVAEKIKGLSKGQDSKAIPENQTLFTEYNVMKTELNLIGINLEKALLGEMEVFDFFNHLDTLTENWEQTLGEDEQSIFYEAQMDLECYYDSFSGYMEAYGKEQKSDFIIKACFSYLLYYIMAKGSYLKSVV